MIDFTPSEVSDYYAARIGPALKQTRAKIWRCGCPVHGGKDANFAINSQTGEAYCFSQCNQGWDMIGLEMAITNRSFQDCKKTVFQVVGRPEPTRDELDIIATFDYTDEQGKLLYQVVRKPDAVGADGERKKVFSQRRPVNGNQWDWSLKGVRLVPYQLPLVAKADFVAVVEGEKCARALTKAGIVATCNNGGAGHFSPSLAPLFEGKHVMILPDNDEPGKKHALQVAVLLSGVAASVKIVILPSLPPKGDVADFLLAGGTVEQIKSDYKRAAEWTPEWEFPAPATESEYDKYVRTIEQCVEESGGLEKFWDLASQDGVPTPWFRLTRALGGGMRPGEVYVIGGNQGSGKTSLVLQFIVAALRARRGVLEFSMEMTHRDVFHRMAAIEARVDLLAFRDMQRAKKTGHMDYTDALHRLNVALSELNDYPLLVTTKSSVTPEFLLAETQRLRSRQRIDLVVIDHMQLMAATGTTRGDYEKFTAISRITKQVAMELKIPVLLASQTSRSNAADKRTELDVSDLRGTGAIEEDAAAVMLIYPDKDDRDRRLLDKTFVSQCMSWLKVGKNRYGLQGTYFELMHNKWATRFDEVDREAMTERRQIA